MIIRKKGEQGSSAFALIASIVALGMAGMAVQQTFLSTKRSVDDSRITQSREVVQGGAMNSLAVFKSLLSTRKDASGRYIPSVYAENYFATDWSLKSNSQLPASDFTLDTAAGGTFKNFSDLNMNSEMVSAIMKNQKPGNAGKTTFKLRVLRPVFAKDLPFYAEAVRVNVQGEIHENNKVQKVDFDANIPLAKPVPEKPKLEFRPVSGGIWAEVKEGADLSSGEMEFRVLASGVAFKAELLLDGAVAAKLAGGDGKGVSLANNYASVDAQIGEAVRFDLSKETSSGGETTDPGEDQWQEAQCTTLGGGGGGAGNVLSRNRTLQAKVYGVDTKVDPIETTPVTVIASIPSDWGSAKGSTKAVGLAAYKNSCTTECPYVNDDETGVSLSNAVQKDRSKDYSGLYTFNEALKWKINTKKLCLSFAHIPKSNNSFTFFDSRVMVYNVKSCSRKFLFERKACGCVTEDTMITLGDGKSTKRIDQLEPTDTVWNPLLRKAFPIRKVTQGPEKVPMIELKLGGKTIKATGNHPFISKKGNVAAFRLHAGDQILLGDDEWVKIDDVTAIAAGETPPVVWNLEVEAPDYDLDAHRIVANGIATGDLVIQRLLETKALANAD
ncbi:MAG: hypothetical protein EOP10_03195 [Proteobacteria bacterium]|nr:MAG: hypothetical protein EOP10_03195 [Pseudomonadota bacterium]